MALHITNTHTHNISSMCVLFHFLFLIQFTFQSATRIVFYVVCDGGHDMNELIWLQNCNQIGLELLTLYKIKINWFWMKKERKKRNKRIYFIHMHSYTYIHTHATPFTAIRHICERKKVNTTIIITIIPQISHNHLNVVSASYIFAPFTHFSQHTPHVILWVFDYDKADRLVGNFILAKHFIIEQPLENDGKELLRFFSFFVRIAILFRSFCSVQRYSYSYFETICSFY